MEELLTSHALYCANHRLYQSLYIIYGLIVSGGVAGDKVAWGALHGCPLQQSERPYWYNSGTEDM